MTFPIRQFTIALALAGTSLAWAQTPAPAPKEAPGPAATPPTPATPPPSAWTKNGIDIYLLGDVFGDFNFNHPKGGVNQLYNFNDRANQVRISFGKVALEKASGMFGFRVDAGGGRTAELVGAFDDAPEEFKYLEQMYVEFRPNKAHGMQIDFGKFVTSAGAEVIESNANWNYSRSLLFVLAIPYYHFGARATIPVNKGFTAGVQLVNGWNSLGTNNSFETVGLIGNFTFKKGTWANDYYTGPQQAGPVKSYRQLYDTTLVINANDKTSLYLNFDYGTDKLPNTPRASWVGVEGAARFQVTPRFAVAPRFGVFNDMDGFSTGNAQTVKEITLTGEMKIVKGLTSRLEYRRDTSDKPFFDRGTRQTIAKNQSTLTLALIAYFGPK